MEKFLQTCFLALLCLAGSPSSAQSRVADSPGADFLHRSGLSVSPHSGDAHRGGGTLSDTFLKVQQHTATDCTLRTADCQSPGFSLVDTATSQGQEGGIPSAQVGEGTVLIYGELINPDSLAPLSAVFRPYYLNEKSGLEEVGQEVDLLNGSFFDGVVDPRAKKFLIQSPAMDRPGYFSLKLGSRSLMENYLIFPGDSLKVFIQLQDNRLVFGGPDAGTAEIQYLLKRSRANDELDTPRKLVLENPENLLSQSDNRQLWNAQQDVFGARLEFETLDERSLSALLGQISGFSAEMVSSKNWISALLEKLPEDRRELVLLDYLSSFYYAKLYTFYRFYFPAMSGFLDAEQMDRYYIQIRQLLEDLPVNAFSDSAKLVSGPWLEMELDRLSLISLLGQESFLSAMQREHSGELAERLGVAFLNQNLRRYPDPVSLLGQYGKFIQTKPWTGKLAALKSATVPGEEIIDLELETLTGETLRLRDQLGKPTLLYFYFSTCVHSAHYFKDMLFPVYLKRAKDLGVQLIAISVDRKPELWKSKSDVYSDPSIPNYRLLPDSKSLWKSRYNIAGYPRTFVLDHSGKILSFDLNRESRESLVGDLYRLFQTDSSFNPITQP